MAKIYSVHGAKTKTSLFHAELVQEQESEGIFAESPKAKVGEAKNSQLVDSEPAHTEITIQVSAPNMFHAANGGWVNQPTHVMLFNGCR